MRGAAWLLTIWLALPAAAQTNPALNAPGAPILEPATVTRYSDWTLRFPTAEKAEAHLREYKGVYGGDQAHAAAVDLDGKLKGYRILSVEFKQVEGSTKYQYRARAKIEISLEPYELNLAAARNKARAEAEGAAPITDELEARMAELEAEDEALSAAVVEAAVGDLMDKINDVEVMQNTLVGVLARLGGKGAALGLWRGGLTADRYVSRLSEMAARVEAARQSVTGLQDHAWRKTSSIFDDFMRELDALETGGLNWDTYPTRYGGTDPDVEAFWKARDALHEAVKGAEKQAVTYDHQIFQEQMQRTTRFFKREDKREEMQKEAILARYTRDDDPDTDDTAQDSAGDAAGAARDDTAHLKKALRGKTPTEDLREEMDAQDATEPQEERAAPAAPLRRAARSEVPSPLRVAARAETAGISSVDADNPLGDRARQDRPETAPKVATPRTPFARLRQDERLAEEREERVASIQLTTRTGADFRGVLEGFVAEEEANGQEAYVLLGYLENGVAQEAWARCEDERKTYQNGLIDALKARCPAGYDSGFRRMKEASSTPKELYSRLTATCSGDFFVWVGSDRYPENSGRREYSKWHWNELAKIKEDTYGRYQCGEEPGLEFVRMGEPVRVVFAKDGGGAEELRNWAREAFRSDAEVRIASDPAGLEGRFAASGGPLPDLSGAPFELYENSALKEVRDMLEEHP
ncbi:hypothetical protein KBY27_12405 [Ruegeria pomeroyi]|uniref:Lipoprotein n=1 Tax=Ruegeria pomeroyi TaxID=89184 RepID=A0A9Q3WLR8_9RHOB|nr:hypothetical protein [Ruegeria pomeroyi]MCE8538254.1 hypothetical protein [Ruegeria pomeroyi]